MRVLSGVSLVGLLAVYAPLVGYVAYWTALFLWCMVTQPSWLGDPEGVLVGCGVAVTLVLTTALCVWGGILMLLAACGDLCPSPDRIGSVRARLSCWLIGRLGYRLYGQLRWWAHPVRCAEYAEFCTGYVNYVAAQETNDPEEAAREADAGYRDARREYWLTLLVGPHLLTGCRRIRRVLFPS